MTDKLTELLELAGIYQPKPFDTGVQFNTIDGDTCARKYVVPACLLAPEMARVILSVEQCLKIIAISDDMLQSNWANTALQKIAALKNGE